MSNAHEFTMKTIDGKEKKLSDYAGKVLLVVNVASRCGYTPQYTGLEALHRELNGKGLAIIGVPCNQFGEQEPGTSEQIKSFCSTKYDVTFDIMAKVDVNGDAAHPFYKWLTSQSDKPGPIKWNFCKFVVGKDGKFVARFGSSTEPDSKTLRDAITSAM